MKNWKLIALLAAALAGAGPQEEATGRYANVNGLKIYYEIHGVGKPLVLLHGAFGWAATYPALAKDRQVIAVELQGHGHTGDIDRPLSYEQLADDVAALLKHLKIEKADIFGYSMGGTVALGVAARHPGLAGRVAVFGSHAGRIDDSYNPEILAQFKALPADFAPPFLKEPYDKVAPDPSKWPALVAKIKKMALEWNGYTPDQLRSIKARVLITLGDNDAPSVEHATAMFRRIPGSQLAVFPGADHFLPLQDPDRLLPTIARFLDSDK